MRSKDTYKVDVPARNGDDVSCKSFDIDDAIEETGFGKFHIFLTLSCGMCMLSVNLECYSISYILPAAECDMNLLVWEKTVLTSVGIVGILATQFFWGFISDTKGRKQCLVYTLACSFLCTVAATFSPYLWMFAGFRFLNGALISCSSATVFAYLGEFMPNKYRSSAISCACIFVGLAIALIPALAWILLPLEFEVDFLGFRMQSWRLYLLLCGLPSLLASSALAFFPESPKYLAQFERLPEALDILRYIYKFNTGKESPIMFLHGKNMEKEFEQNMLLHFFKQLLNLFRIKYLSKTLMGCALQFGTFSVSSGLLLWYTDILKQIGDSNQDMTACQALSLSRTRNDSDFECSANLDTSIFQQNLLIGGFYLGGFVTVSCLIRLLGIKPILVASLGTAGISAGCLYWVVNKTAIDYLFLDMFVLTGLCVGLINAAIVDLFDTKLRALAVCMVLFFGRLGSVVSSSVLGYMLAWNCDVAFFMYSAILIVISIIAFFLPRYRT